MVNKNIFFTGPIILTLMQLDKEIHETSVYISRIVKLKVFVFF